MSETEDREFVEAQLMELVERGHAELVGVDEDGELRWRITEAGKRYVENMLGEGATP